MNDDDEFEKDGWMMGLMTDGWIGMDGGGGGKAARWMVRWIGDGDARSGGPEIPVASASTGSTVRHRYSSTVTTNGPSPSIDIVLAVVVARYRYPSGKSSSDQWKMKMAKKGHFISVIPYGNFFDIPFPPSEPTLRTAVPFFVNFLSPGQEKNSDGCMYAAATTVSCLRLPSCVVRVWLSWQLSEKVTKDEGSRKPSLDPPRPMRNPVGEKKGMTNR